VWKREGGLRANGNGKLSDLVANPSVIVTAILVSYPIMIPSLRRVRKTERE
jgi:hypothetical protein